MQIRRLIRGSTPLLISIPHMGTFLPPEIKSRMTNPALKLPDTDWHLDKLYWFAVDMGASLLMAANSRYVIDLNRAPNDGQSFHDPDAEAEAAPPPKPKGPLELDTEKSWLKNVRERPVAPAEPEYQTTPLCPDETFAGDRIYKHGEEPDTIEKLNRIASYWSPYHETIAEELQRIRQEFGYAILYDAHSIQSVVPRLFKGQLPDLNIGTNRGTSCAQTLADVVYKAAVGRGFSTVVNERFIGGYITRHYGQPQHHIHALQMELSQINYMDENYPYHYDSVKAASLQKVLKNVITSVLEWNGNEYL